MLRHPLKKLDSKQLIWLFGLSTAASFLLMSFLGSVGEPLKTTKGNLPFGISDGILALQFAGDPATAKEIIDTWRGDTVEAAKRSLKIDFLFIVTYVLAISCGCVWAANAFRNSIFWLTAIGETLGWLVLFAGILDGIENVSLLRQLKVSAMSPYAEMAYWCALCKFIIVFFGLLYVLSCLAYFGSFRLRPLRN